MWQALDIDRRRAVVAELLFVTVFPAPKGRLRGWQPGDSYFHAESVHIHWKTPE